ncbi:MAG: porphobilinogen synthase [Clostridia bacterium]|nr:porphobilinogen synthase [Clostridia bacterium]
MNRFRRLRRTEALRDLVAETRLCVKDFLYPVFVVEGEDCKEPVPSMPGIFRWSPDRIGELLQEVVSCGVPGILLFGIPAHKDAAGSSAYDPDGIVQRAIRQIKEEYPGLLVVADICLCEYTDHGHCGLVKDGVILNDETLPMLAKMAVTCAQAGADLVAPSDMMDGDVAAIREALDEAGYEDLPIMGYSAKYASAYYGPFRDAAGSAPCFGDRRSYQMDVRNGAEGVREVLNDQEAGADLVMVKPALAFLDVLKEVSEECRVPIACYNVSGEYSMVKAAAQNGWIDERRIVLENLTAMKRAGASVIITYHALDAARWLKEAE